jgi:hypothetical protein
MKPEGSGLPEPQENEGFLPPQLWVPQSGPLTEAIASRWCQEPWRPVLVEQPGDGLPLLAFFRHRWGARRHAPNKKGLTGEVRADPLPVRPLLASALLRPRAFYGRLGKTCPAQSRRRREVKRLIARRHCGFSSKCRLSKHSCRAADRLRQKCAMARNRCRDSRCAGCPIDG